MLRSTGMALLIALVSAVGCGGGSGGSGSALQPGKGSGGSVNAVAVSPAGIGQVWEGTQVQFTANQPVTWSVQEGIGGGSIDSNGLYTAPRAVGTFHVVATSQADPRKSGTAQVQVPPVSVSIGPPAETLRVEGQRIFGGFATAADQHVTWYLQEGAAAGSIDASGLYTAPSTTGTFHLVATAVFDPKATAIAPITVVSVGFVPIGDMAVARSGHTATLLIDGEVLIAGGTSDAAHSADMFDPRSGSFNPVKGPMVYVRSGHCASPLSDGRVLVAGGGDGSTTLFKTAELFDPSTQRFVATGDLNEPRTGATATLLPGGQVLIAGGEDGGGALLSSAELYDPGTGTFSLLGDMHSPRAQHTATLLSSGKVLLVGDGTESATAELFDPATHAFTVSGSMIQARAHHSATLLPSGKVLVLGGSRAGLSLDSAEIFDPATGRFQSAGKLLAARDLHAATLLPSGMVLVTGGFVRGFDGDASPYFETMSTAELFDPVASASTPATSLQAGRAEHVATLLNDGQVLVSGGIAGFQELCCHPHPRIVPLSSAELYK